MHKGNNTNWADALFIEPLRAGLRGDPHLRSELKKALNTTEPPKTVAQFEVLINVTLKNLGVDMESDETQVWIDRYPNDGMSAGYIHLATWRNQNIPELIKRFVALVQKNRNQ